VTDALLTEDISKEPINLIEEENTCCRSNTCSPFQINSNVQSVMMIQLTHGDKFNRDHK